MVDVEVRNEGSIFLFCPHSPRGSEWIRDNVSDDAQWWGSMLVVEHRYALDLVQGMLNDGLKVT